MSAPLSTILVGAGSALGLFAAHEAVDSQRHRVSECAQSLGNSPVVATSAPEACDSYDFPTMKTIDRGEVLGEVFYLPSGNDFTETHKGDGYPILAYILLPLGGAALAYCVSLVLDD